MYAKKLLGFLPIVFIVLIWVVLVFANFTPGVWLTGWDNLHWEFNHLLNLKRAISAAWQEYQGLGHVGGMAHAADLPRQIIMLLASIFVPVNLLRWVWTFAMLLVGPLGIYFLFDRFLFSKADALQRKAAGVVASSFYLLNLATLQYFFTSFDTFVSFFGFFPWLVALALNYFSKGDKKSLLVFALVSLLATPAFYVQTLFVVYVIFLIPIILENVISKKVEGLKRGLVFGLIVFLVNSFWLMPAAYFSLNNSGDVINSQQNQIASEETRIFNEARGSFEDIVLLRGYWFDYYDTNDRGSFEYLYQTWISYLENSNFQKISYLVFGLAILGLIFAIFTKDSKIRFSGILLLVLCYFMLATINPPFGNLYKTISEKYLVLAEMFRNSFTKWSIPLAFVFSLGLGFLVFKLFDLLKGKLRVLFILPSVLLIATLIYSVLPIFQGNLVSSRFKREIPGYYFETFKYFESLPKDGRVATFPIQSFWGWNFYDWGYRGSGFLWYGIEQPLLDRAFDVWSSENETFYNEAALSLYSEDKEKFLKVLEKYQVKYLLFDESVINPGAPTDILYSAKIKELDAASDKVSLIKEIGKIKIYQTSVGSNKFISTPSSYSLVDADLIYSQADPIYQNLGNYVQKEEGETYPFVNFDSRKMPKIIYEGDKVTLIGETLNFDNKKYLSVSKLSEDSDFAPIVYLNDQKRLQADLEIPQNQRIIADFDADSVFEQVRNCDLVRKGTVSKRKEEGLVNYKAEGGGVVCDFYNFGNVLHNKAYVLRVKGENKSGRALKIYLINWRNERVDIQQLLPTGKFDESIVLLPQNTDGLGYTLNLETRSFGNVASENQIEKIEFVPIPYEWLSQIKLVPEGSIKVENDLAIRNVVKLNTSYYSVDVGGAGLLVLNQGYDPGWIAIPIKKSQFGIFKFQTPDWKSKLEHVKVNSWENGWYLEPTDSQTILLLFWPQYLEWVGMTLGAITLVIIAIYPERLMRSIKSELRDLPDRTIDKPA